MRNCDGARHHLRVRPIADSQIEQARRLGEYFVFTKEGLEGIDLSVRQLQLLGQDSLELGEHHLRHQQIVLCQDQSQDVGG
jgi:hypothetical protein